MKHQSQTGLEACGGAVHYFCVKFNKGNWTTPYYLDEESGLRIDRFAWASPLGTVLIGSSLDSFWGDTLKQSRRGRILCLASYFSLSSYYYWMIPYLDIPDVT